MIEFLCACEPDTLALVTGLWIEQLPYMIRPYHVKVCCAALGAVCATRDARVLAASVQVKIEAAESGDSVSSRTRSKGGGERTASVALPQAAMRELQAMWHLAREHGTRVDERGREVCDLEVAGVDPPSRVVTHHA